MQRKLSAILSADVVGYSRMMEADEADTLNRLKANRQSIFDPKVAENGGRVFKLMGDGALVEFSSIVAAAECALAIQRETESAERDLPAAKRIRYRIGVNLGDVIVEGDDIYGDGVNVAARLQTLAEPGGIAVSRGVREHMDGKVDAEFKDMGEHTVKNIERPIHVFAVKPRPKPAPAQVSVCVLPFANMSGDIEQEYFSDGISEDIITDLSKVSALSVVSRNTAFTFKGKAVEAIHVAQQLKVSHILEGSVRKSGNRVRITAQLIDGAKDNHVWAERYDRDLDDIFALQDEISEAIVKALKLKLLPEEKKAIEKRGTENVEAYNLYLMARQLYAAGFQGDLRRNEAIIRLAMRATEIDPSYARAWALLALGQFMLRYANGTGDGGSEAVERALALDANLAEAHAVRARIFAEDGRSDDAVAAIRTALGLDSESYEVNKAAGILSFGRRDLEDAIRYWEKATALMETDFASAGMLVTCYTALNDKLGAVRAAQVVLARVEKVLAQDSNNGAAIGYCADALVVLGQAERAKEWIKRAILIEPDNWNMRYNFACALATSLNENDAALEMLVPVFKRATAGFLNHAKADPDLDPLRGDPRFQAMIAATEARLAATEMAAQTP